MTTDPSALHMFRSAQAYCHIRIFRNMKEVLSIFRLYFHYALAGLIYKILMTWILMIGFISNIAQFWAFEIVKLYYDIYNGDIEETQKKPKQEHDHPNFAFMTKVSEKGDTVEVFYSNSKTGEVDNCDTCNVAKDETMFDGDLEKVNFQGGLNVGGYAPLSGIVFAPWTWKEEEGRTHKFRMKTYYFPESPVNIISVNEVAKLLKDDVGTSIQKFGRHSIFIWNKEKIIETIIH